MAKFELQGMLGGIEADNGDGGLSWTYLVLDGYDLDAQIIRKLDTYSRWGPVRITIEQLAPPEGEALTILAEDNDG